MKHMQRLGKAIMFPVACLPLCGILMGLGYLLCPASMQSGSVEGFLPVLGWYLVKAGGALIDHIPLLFAVGVGVGLADDRDGMAGLSALTAWLMITTLLKPDNVSRMIPSLSENTLRAFEKIENPFIGILSGVIGAVCYNRFKNTRLPEWLAFFSGKRCTVIVSGTAAVLVSAVLLAAWPLLFGALVRLGMRIAGLGSAGAGLYAFLNRLLIPFGLHHALNNVFWFDTIGLGDLTHFWAGHTSADVSWSLGMYMSGFFPCMMFGVPAAALAMIRSAPKRRRKAAAGILTAGALCSFVCGITEPFEFAFMFTAPALYAAYALLYGLFSWASAAIGFRAGFAFSGGLTDLIFSASLPAAQKTWLILPLGAAAFALFYLVFRLMITGLDLKTPGRGDPEEDAKEAAPADSGENRDSRMAETILRGLGGAGNVISVDNCITRLRLEIRDMGKVDEPVILSSGAAGLVRSGKNALQVVIGTQVEFTAREMKRLCAFGAAEGTAPAPAEAVPGAPEGTEPAQAEEASGAPEGTEPAAPAKKRRRVTRRDPIFGLPDGAGDGTAEGGGADSSRTETGNAKEIRSPAEGELVPMAEIPDAVFSEGILGECVGIIPETGEICAPAEGEVTSAAAARHALSIRGDGEEILVHAGIDTVNLQGEGFTMLVREGDRVAQGQPVLKADLELIRARGYNPMIIVVRVRDE